MDGNSSSTSTSVGLLYHFHSSYSCKPCGRMPRKSWDLRGQPLTAKIKFLKKTRFAGCVCVIHDKLKSLMSNEFISGKLSTELCCISINQLQLFSLDRTSDVLVFLHIVETVSFLHMTSSEQTRTSVSALINENREVPDWTSLNYSALETLPVPAPLLLSSIISCWFGDSDSVYKHESVHGLSQPLPHTDKNREWTVGGTARGNVAGLEKA